MSPSHQIITHITSLSENLKVSVEENKRDMYIVRNVLDIPFTHSREHTRLGESKKLY